MHFNGYLHYVTLPCDTVVYAGGLGFGVSVVLTLPFVGSGVALSMYIMFRMPSFSIFLIWIFTPVTLNNPVLHVNILSYRLEVSLTYAMKANGGTST